MGLMKDSTKLCKGHSSMLSMKTNMTEMKCCLQFSWGTIQQTWFNRSFTFCCDVWKRSVCNSFSSSSTKQLYDQLKKLKKFEVQLSYLNDVLVSHAVDHLYHLVTGCTETEAEAACSQLRKSLPK
ncbi:uncharacterized protein [Apostichopus japonicus]|uniref:uncharacterized protein n=1 Tax=Stichopus japonicus TaxID=307972 RepID=UPI003AB3C92C